MRKSYFFAAALSVAVLAGCSQDEHLDFVNQEKSDFKGVVEVMGTRTSLTNENKVVWSDGDQVSIFEGDNANSLYQVNGITNGVANFEFVSYIDPATWVDLDANYAIYPYSESNSIAEDGTISAPVPAAYTFKDKASSIESALMVAKSTTTKLNFINTQGMIRLRLNAKKPTKYGKIQSIKLTSANNNLTGTATFSFAETTTPSAVITGTGAGKELTINLDESLKNELPSSTTNQFVEFYVPVVPTDFAAGDLTLTVVGENATYEKNITVAISVGRKVIKGIKHTLDGGGFEGEIDGETTEAWDGETLTEVTPVNGVYTITKASELAWLAAKALTTNNGTAETATIDLQKDIDMGGFEFSSIVAQRGDALIFKGNNKVISNVKIVSGSNDNGSGQAGMFYSYPNSTLEVSDLTLENVTVTTDEDATAGYGAALIGFCEGAVKLNNVDVVNATVVGVKSSGLFVGHLSGSLEATDCELAGTVTLNYISGEPNGHYAGKYVGTIAGSASFTNCTVNATVSGSLKAENAGDVFGRMTAAGSLMIDGMRCVNSASMLKTVVGAGVTNIFLMDGEYDVADCGGKTLTISGSKNAVLSVKNEGEDGCDYGFDGSNVTFNGITVNTTSNTGSYKGYARLTATYNDCAFIGAYTSHQKQTFNRCSFDTQNGYFWIWGATEVTFDDCDWGTNSKAILAHGGTSTVININNCRFNATEKGYTGSGDNTAVVEIDPTGSNIYTINFTGNNTKTEHYAGWYRIKDNSTGHVVTGVQ